MCGGMRKRVLRRSLGQKERVEVVKNGSVNEICEDEDSSR
jgi:hypothetical protein